MYISTDDAQDLTRWNSDLVQFAKVTDPSSDSCIALLGFPHRWYVGSKSGCSCTFRHLCSPSEEDWFSEPEDWYPEEPDALEATRELYRILRAIVSSGHQVDLIDRWLDTSPKDIVTADVSLGALTEGAFRLIEDHRLVFGQGGP